MDLDLFKTVRETIDWLIGKYKLATNNNEKQNLSTVANQISKVATNNAIFIEELKKALSSNNELIDLDNITSAIQIAESDIDKLSELIKKIDLDSSKYTFSFKHGLEELTQLKQIKIIELQEMISKKMISKDRSIKDIISELESFRQRWIDLGNTIDQLFKEKS